MAAKDIVESLLPEARTDAKVSAFLAQELEFIEQEITRFQYPSIKFRTLVPVDNNYPAGVETISYKEYDSYGMAKFISHYGDDMPFAEVKGEKFSSNVESMGVGYMYTTQELRAAAMSGFPLDRERAQTAGEMIERKMDHTAALGAPEVNMKGFARHPNVPIDTPTADGTGSSTLFANKSPSQILRDLHAFVQGMVDDTLEIHTPDTLLMPPHLWGVLTSTYLDSTARSTIMSAFLETNPWIKSAGSWRHLTAAGDDGGGRLVAYRRDPRICKVAIPMEAIQHEPEKEGLSFKVPMEARFGGVIVKQPLAMRYLDGAV